MAPQRIWTFTNLNYTYEGYYVTDFYRTLYRATVDMGFTATEWLQARGFYEGGTEAVVSRIIATRESETKYVLDGMTINAKLVWKNVPKPGAPEGAENPPLAPKGSFSLNVNGFIVLDYLNVWGKSPILKLFSGLRDNIMRRRMKGNLTMISRKEGDQLIKTLKDFANFIPNIK